MKISLCVKHNDKWKKACQFRTNLLLCCWTEKRKNPHIEIPCGHPHLLFRFKACEHARSIVSLVAPVYISPPPPPRSCSGSVLLPAPGEAVCPVAWQRKVETDARRKPCWKGQPVLEPPSICLLPGGDVHSAYSGISSFWVAGEEVGGRRLF